MIQNEMATSMPGTSPNGLDQDLHLVDRIIYLSALTSQRSAIDPMLEDLRAVTATWQRDQVLAEPQRESLVTLETNLKKYLITSDPLRSFTAESLEDRLHAQDNANARSKANRNLLTILAISVVSVILVFLAAPGNLSLATRFAVSVPAFFVVITVGTTWFYLTTLRDFNKDVRRAFVLFCIGVGVLALSFIHYVVIEFFRLYDVHAVFRYAGIPAIVGLSYIFMYYGLRIYARLVGVKNFFTSQWALWGVLALAAVALLLAPRASVPSDTYFVLSLLGGIPIAIVPLFNLILLWDIRKRVTASYAKPLTWLLAGMMAFTLGGFSAIIAFLMIGELYGTAMSLITAVCGISPMLLMLYTSYLFKRELSR